MSRDVVQFCGVRAGVGDLWVLAVVGEGVVVGEAREVDNPGFGVDLSGVEEHPAALKPTRQGMTRLSFDVEMWRRGITSVPLLPQTRAEIEADLRVRLLESVAADLDVVLDFSFWSRPMRDEWRRLLEPLGVVPETIFLATDRTTVLQRVRDRQGNHSDDYVIPEDLAAQYIDNFEAPTPDEGPLTVIRA